MFFVDTHCHLDHAFSGKTLETVLLGGKERHIRYWVVPAVTASSSLHVHELAEQYPSVFCAVGIHPWYAPAAGALTDELSALIQLLQRPENKIVAIGEIGLASNLGEPNKVDQEELFWEQLALAQQAKLPVLLHSTANPGQLASYLAQANLSRKGVIHGFSGSLESGMQFIKLGYKLGIGGIISHPAARKIRSAVAKFPLSSLVLETDAPYMPLFGEQTAPNHPYQLLKIFDCLCSLRSEAFECIAQAIYQNSCELFSPQLR